MKAHPIAIEFLRSAIFVVAGILATAASATDARPRAPLFADIGRHHHPVTTRSPEAQRYFDQGIMLLFNFNHREAVRSFRAAAELDPQCAMARWGEAFAHGPHINGPMTEEAVAPAWEALRRAQALAAAAGPRERAYIEALAARYVAPGVKHDRPALDRAFADAMRRVVAAYPDDHDAAVFQVDAWMNTTPWNYWEADKRTPRPETVAALRAMEQVMARAPDHPGANHIYIHLVEAGPAPERGLPSAGRLRRYAPAAGHLVHMPSHIYIRVGQYQDAVEANEEAARADRAYIAACQVQGFYPGVYFPHNVHFLWYALMFQGNGGRALAAAREVAAYAQSALCGTTVLEKPRLTWLPIVTHLRFGQWDRVLALAEPGADLPFDRAMWRFARARALAAQGRADAAARETQALDELAVSEAVKAVDSPYFPANQVLVVARRLAHAGVAGARGHRDEQVALLREAVAAEQALPYMEPAFWIFPTRPALGAALLEAGRAPEAEAEFRADLAEFPRNGWALFGLAEALRRQGRTEAAAMVEREFAAAWSQSDRKLQLDWL